MRTVFGFLVGFFLIGWTSSEGIPTGDEARLQWLTQRRSGGGMVTLSTEEVTQLLFNPSRPFEAVVVMGTEGCDLCHQIKNVFDTVAKDMYKTQILAKPVFLFYVSLTQADAVIISGMGLRTVPEIIHFESGSSYPKKHRDGSPAKYPVRGEEALRASSVMIFLNERVKTNFKARKTGTVSAHAVFKSLVPVGTIVACIIAGLAVPLNWYKAPMFWFFCCLVIYAFGVSGLYFAVHHGSPLWTIEDDGLHLIAHGSRHQYVVEGFIAALLYIVTGGVLILIPDLPRRLTSPSLKMMSSVALLGALVVLSSSLYKMFWIKYPYMGTYSYN
eukprot:CAMPEP_0184683100 /NCGR_PEP_ID=MMETSP0312-20130426/9969_1 /TAXON_ID=31354 /ORGANISM="Compsopogon coeruleus, Strain SAG 36.94" /LENGTH=328 /DNA_ID=CAMNT_0027135187 /DNA_START=15 /DNA_END=1001 /DNA_ORIENTATION=-